MEPIEHRNLTDRELDGMLQRWKAPEAPARLHAALFPAPDMPWWRRSIRIPLPVAACLMLLLLAGVWRSLSPRERVVTQIVYREHAAGTVSFRDLRPVTELRPRIIRRGHAEN
jgi:hypothetical protein